MENFRQARNSNERPIESEQKKRPKIGNLIRAIGFMALGATAVEGVQQVSRVLSPEHTAMSSESPDLLSISVPEAKAFTEFWEENREDALSLVHSENGEDSTIGKEFIETMTQAIHKVEKIAQMEADLKGEHDELIGLWNEIQLQQQLLEAQGVSFDVEQGQVEGNFTDWDSWTQTVAEETPGSVIKDQVEFALEQEPIDPNKQ